MGLGANDVGVGPPTLRGTDRAWLRTRGQAARTGLSGRTSRGGDQSSDDWSALCFTSQRPPSS